MYVADRDTANDVFCQECGNIADRSTLNTDGFCEDCAVFHKTLDMFQAEDENKRFTFCVGCEDAPDGSVGLNFDLDDNGYCPECSALFCDVCGQEHNCLHEQNAGYCQHCREPIADWSIS